MQSSSYPHPKFKPGNICRIKQANPDRTFWYHRELGVGALVEIASAHSASAVPGENWDYEAEDHIHRGCIGENDLELVAENSGRHLEEIARIASISPDEWDEMVEDSTPKPAIEVLFCPSQILAAAEFVAENNSFCSDPVDKIEEKIYSYIRDEAKSDNHKRFVSTMGFTLMFFRDDDMLEVDVTVDPVVSNKGDFVLAELDSNDKLVAQYPNR